MRPFPPTALPSARGLLARAAVDLRRADGQLDHHDTLDHAGRALGRVPPLARDPRPQDGQDLVAAEGGAALGGVEDAIEDGFFAREIGDASWLQQREIDGRKRLIVGVNAYEQADAGVPIQLVDPSVVDVQQRRLAAVRAERVGGKQA